MRAIFETEGYGRIEATKDGGAYFTREDYLTEINSEGRFQNTFGTTFQIHWPVTRLSEDAILEVIEPRQIGRIKPAMPMRLIEKINGFDGEVYRLECPCQQVFVWNKLEANTIRQEGRDYARCPNCRRLWLPD